MELFSFVEKEYSWGILDEGNRDTKNLDEKLKEKSLFYDQLINVKAYEESK